MSFPRPEAKAALARWREALAGGALIALGLWLLGGVGLARLFGVAATILGALLLWEGLRRARRPRDGGGAGVLVVDERQVTYLGPLGGGAVSVEALRRVEVRSDGDGFVWLLWGDEPRPLVVPGDAEGAGRLFDALAPLDGLDETQVVAMARERTRGARVIWERDPPRLH